MNILEEIIQFKRQEVQEKLSSIRPSQLTRQESDSRVPLDFRKALQADGLSVIAEVKKASPSKGLIRPDFHPVEIASSYQEYGASCLSVLTEEKYFKGNPEYLKSIRQKVNIPLLRKDFMVDERQVRESYDLGADAILLIVSALKKEEILHFQQLAKSFGLTCLVEIHSEKELQIALECKANLIGINNRNLVTFETRLEHSIELKEKIPEDIVKVSESGIRTQEDCTLLLNSGFDAILVGETLMRQPNPGKEIHNLLGK